METFIRKAYDFFNIGRADEEKKWLSEFVDHVEKYIFKDPCSHTYIELSLIILERLTVLTQKETLDQNDDDDDDQQISRSSQYQLLSMSSLSAKREMCSGQLNNDNNEDEVTSSSGVKFGCRHLVPVVPSFLLGYLRWCPSTLEPSSFPTCGSLFLEDNSGYLPIEISNPDKKWLDQLVVVPSWTFVPAPENLHQKSYQAASLSTNGYIEATTSCVPTFLKICSSPRPLPLPDSKSLNEYKEISRTAKQTVISLHGKVTAVSPVHSMSNSKPFFFVELTCPDSSISTPVVIQGAQFMHWVHFLRIEKMYIFTDLRDTTMNKGSKSERKILASTKTSRFLEYYKQNKSSESKKRKPDESIKGDNHITMPSKRLKNIDGKAQVAMVNTTDQDQAKVSVSKIGQPRILSYKGVITRCYPHPHIGCYELDNKIRLYTVHQPCPSIGRGLRVGAEVSLYNVHLVKKGKDVLGLCCCTLSSLRVTKFSSLDSEWKPTVLNTSPFALHGQNMSLQKYVDFTHTCEKLLQKFSKTERPSSLIGYSSSRHKSSSKNKVVQRSVIEKLLDGSKSLVTIPQQPRNIYQEFFDRPHTCYPTRLESASLPTLYTIDELKQIVLDKTKGVSWENGTKEGSSESSDWLYHVVDCNDIKEGLILLGQLRSSSTTGYLKLSDDTGNIPLHITTNGQDSCADEMSGIKNLLDYRHCIVQISKFSIIIEKFQNSILESRAGEKRTRMYVQTLTNDLKQLNAKKASLAEVGNTLNKHVAEEEMAKRIEERTEASCSKEQPNDSLSEAASNQRIGAEPEKSRDQPVTCKESDGTCLSTCKEPNDTCQFTYKMLFLVLHRENLQLKKKRKVLYACAIDVKVLGFSTNETEGTHDDVCDDVSRMKTMNKSVVLRLQSESISLYPCLYGGCFYVLQEIVGNRSKSIIMQSLNSTSKSLLNVSSSMTVTQVRLRTGDVTKECHASNVVDSKEEEKESAVVMAMECARQRFLCGVEDKLQSVEGILNLNINKSGSTEVGVKQINFTGRVIRRELRLSDTCGQLLPGKNVLVPHFGPLEETTVHQLELGYGYLGNNTMFLRVQDLHSPNTLDVYIDLSTTPYIDGLLPGAVISCRRFLRKVSRSGNVYCSFEACSSLTVTSSAPKNLTKAPPYNDTKVDSTNQQMSSVPDRRLAELIEAEASRNRIHSISRIRCRVTSVQRLCMRWHCSKCSHVIVREECPQGCRANDRFRFCAEARCVVEDGTAEAMVYLSDEVISFLLRLSNDEMSRLKSSALNLELLYQRHSYGYDNLFKGDNANLLSKQSEANTILADRCCAQEVRRSVELYCKPVGNVKKADSTEQEYETRPISINQTEHSTFVQPKLLLKAVDMKDVDYQEEITRLLRTLNKETQDT